MSDETDPDTALTPAEQRVVGLLGLLRPAEREPLPDLAPAVVRAARWQRAVRTVLRATGGLAGTVADEVGFLLGVRRGPGRPDSSLR